MPVCFASGWAMFYVDAVSSRRIFLASKHYLTTTRIYTVCVEDGSDVGVCVFFLCVCKSEKLRYDNEVDHC